MSLISGSRTDKVSWFNAHIAPWTTNAIAIGTTAAAVTDLQTKVTAAQTKLDAQTSAHEAAKTSTLAVKDAVAAMLDTGGDILKAIRAKAAVVGNSVYELAQVPDPAKPTPVGTLGQPTNFKAELGQDGSLIVSWKCVNPRATGTIYQVWRSLNGGTAFTYVGGTGCKSFTDGTVPVGSASIMYKVQAVRSTASGPWAIFTVLFGVSSAGQMTAAVKMAA